MDKLNPLTLISHNNDDSTVLRYITNLGTFSFLGFLKFRQPTELAIKHTLMKLSVQHAEIFVGPFDHPAFFSTGDLDEEVASLLLPRHMMKVLLFLVTQASLSCTPSINQVCRLTKKIYNLMVYRSTAHYQIRLLKK